MGGMRLARESSSGDEWNFMSKGSRDTRKRVQAEIRKVQCRGPRHLGLELVWAAPTGMQNLNVRLLAKKGVCGDDSERGNRVEMEAKGDCASD